MTNKIISIDLDKIMLDMEKDNMFKARKEKNNNSILDQHKLNGKKEEKGKAKSWG